ncbi:SulP family inorganic anion transporter, partial [Gammaproteobacteria bacterium]|nr:SulP family inorganic anion transporter [Gammaproteobacteria bacterium]
RHIPGPVMVVLAGILLNKFYYYFFPDIAQYSHELVNIPISNSFKSLINTINLPAWENWKNPTVYFYAILLAAVASLEALLNLEAVEKLDKNHVYCSRNRELVAQGIGNITSGLIGGLPITSVVVRSSVNIQAGSKSKISAILHGFFILTVISLIPHWINLIPLASLATILIYVGLKLTKPSIYKEMRKQGVSRFLPFLVTIIAIISTNLLTGILIGLFISFFFILRKNSKIPLEIFNEKRPRGIVKHVVLPQQMSFISKASLLSELDRIPKNSDLIIDARFTKYIDKDIQEVIKVYMNQQAPNKNIALNMLGFKNKYKIHDRKDFISVTTHDDQSALNPIDVLDILKEGNNRFTTDNRIHRNLPEEVKATSLNQHPIAIVLGCIDSRVPIETIFDMGVGDVFVARVAGNVIDEDIIASMEFACDVAGAKLILVLGHTMCGAINAACNGDAAGHLGSLLNKIKKSIPENINKLDTNSKEYLTKITKLNVQNSMSCINQESPILKKLINKKQIGLIGAIYDVNSGAVEFQENFFGEK